MNSGDSAAGRWVVHTRNLREKFIKVFGYEPLQVIAITIMTDADNTGEQTISWFGPVRALSQP